MAIISGWMIYPVDDITEFYFIWNTNRGLLLNNRYIKRFVKKNG